MSNVCLKLSQQATKKPPVHFIYQNHIRSRVGIKEGNPIATCAQFKVYKNWTISCSNCLILLWDVRTILEFNTAQVMKLSWHLMCIVVHCFKLRLMHEELLEGTSEEKEQLFFFLVRQTMIWRTLQGSFWTLESWTHALNPKPMNCFL